MHAFLILKSLINLIDFWNKSSVLTCKIYYFSQICNFSNIGSSKKWKFDPAHSRVARSPNHNKLLSLHFGNAVLKTESEEFWRQLPRNLNYLQSTVKNLLVWLKSKLVRAKTTENCQVWPLFEVISFDNSAPKISQSCSKMPLFSKALCVDMQGQRPKTFTDLKSALKTASHKYQPPNPWTFTEKRAPLSSALPS